MYCIIFLVKKSRYMYAHTFEYQVHIVIFPQPPKERGKTQTPLDLASIIVKYRRKGWLRPSRAFNE